MIKSNLLNISNLTTSFINKIILNKLNFKINAGETHVIMGPNGAGKSTLANILSGNYDQYNISGNITYDNTNLLSLSAEKLALNGIFLSFQHPVEIPGLSNINFFKSFLNAKNKHLKINPIENNDFMTLLNTNLKLLNIKSELTNRSVNDGFSGGEKKKNEILQMLLLNPKFVILDEIDSGLDIDSLKLVFNAVNTFKNKNKSILIITHYSRILKYIDVDFVHILHNGTIIKTGDQSLAYDVEKHGYSYFL